MIFAVFNGQLGSFLTVRSNICFITVFPILSPITIHFYILCVGLSIDITYAWIILDIKSS